MLSDSPLDIANIYAFIYFFNYYLIRLKTITKICYIILACKAIFSELFFLVLYLVGYTKVLMLFAHLKTILLKLQADFTSVV